MTTTTTADPVPMYEDDYVLCNTCAAVLLDAYVPVHIAWHESMQPITWTHPQPEGSE